MNIQVKCDKCSKLFETKRSFNTSYVCGKKDEIEDLKNNPYYEKYVDQIATVKKSSPEEFLKRLATMELLKDEKTVKPINALEHSPISRSSTSSFENRLSMVPEKKLDKIVEVEYFKNKTEKEIATIWREKHDGKNAVAGVITANIWKTMTFRFYFGSSIRQGPGYVR